jgi:cytochrome d ubiquinol oxidase subunit I
MTDLLFARSLMALSLIFHIVFAVIGMGMPLLMVIAEVRWIRGRDPAHLDLAKRWAKGTAILFAIGAASGTVLSFELGLLWPEFMRFAGGIIGMPFSLEGFAFFTEAIFLGLYLYGWNRLKPAVHVACGVVVAISGIASAAFVIAANAWMNAPVGFTLENGVVTDVDPVAAMLSPATIPQVLHMTIAAYLAIGAGVAAVHAWYLRDNPDSTFHGHAFRIAIAIVVITAPLQIVSGDFIAKMTAKLQPAKFAAMEAHYHTESEAPIVVGGIPDDETMSVRWAIEIPKALSFLAHGSADAEVTGLDAFPREDWPNAGIVHLAFDLMVGCGMALLALAAWAAIRLVRRRPLTHSRALMTACFIAGPLGFIAIEAGWIVTEVGRQPWIIHGIMRTEHAVTPAPGLVVPFVGFTLMYLLLSVILVLALRSQFRETAPAKRAEA